MNRSSGQYLYKKPNVTFHIVEMQFPLAEWCEQAYI